ncbi:MAG: hypothetical protein HOM47_02375 [Euryarchaeota archaeon]|jgi:hypothetical protein|nr:hypothetical protein [Euryarchaeota archaeon]MBT5184001.1 hypothetical protein [Euryarchaeota archaeon]
MENGSEELFYGFWPLMKRFLLLLLPLWIFLIGYSVGLNIIVASILAGVSVSIVAIFENLKLKREHEFIENGNNVIK